MFCKTCLAAPLNAASSLSTPWQFHFWQLYVHCCGMFDVFHPGLVFSCSRSTSLDSAFLQRRAALPIIETQKSPWNVGDVDSRETFPGKTKTSLSGRGMRLSFGKPATKRDRALQP